MTPSLSPRHGHRPLGGRARTDRASLLPGLVVLSRYQRGWLRADVLAGVTVAAYMIPQVMAYATIAGLPAATGLVAVVVPAVVYLVFGSSRRLSVGPESTVALMTATAIGALGAHGPREQLAFAAAYAIVTGLLCLVGWLGGLGFLADLLSRPVLVGYMAGVAALMVLSQITKLTGIPAGGDTLPLQVLDAVRNAHLVHWPTVALAAALLTMLLVSAHYFPRLPNPLFAVLVGAAAVVALHLTDHGIKVVGAVPHAVPTFEVPDVPLSMVGSMLVPALGIAVVAYSDNVLTGRAFASRESGAVDANQEFLALGVANVASGFFQGFPVSSSGSRTAIGATVGSRTQVYGLVAAVTVIVASFVAAPLLATFPTAALGALVVYAATRLVEVGELRRIAAFRRSEFVLALATIAGVVVFGALGGILLAITLSVLDLLRRVARPHDAVLGYAAGVAGMHDVADYPDARQIPGLVVYRYDSPLFFANAEDFRSRVLEAVDQAERPLEDEDGEGVGPIPRGHHPVEWVVLNTEANTEIDLTSIDAVSELIRELHRRGIVVALARVKHELLEDLEAGGVEKLVGDELVFPTLPTAVSGYLDWYEERHGRPHPIRG